MAFFGGVQQFTKSAVTTSDAVAMYLQVLDGWNILCFYNLPDERKGCFCFLKSFIEIPFAAGFLGQCMGFSVCADWQTPCYHLPWCSSPSHPKSNCKGFWCSLINTSAYLGLMDWSGILPVQIN